MVKCCDLSSLIVHSGSDRTTTRLTRLPRVLCRISKVFSSLDNCLVRAVAWALIARLCSLSYMIHFTVQHLEGNELATHAWVTDKFGSVILGGDFHSGRGEFI